MYKASAPIIIQKYMNTGVDEATVAKWANIQQNYYRDRLEGKEVNPTGRTKEFSQDIYRTISLPEFIAGVFIEDSFREELAKHNYKSTVLSMLDQFIDTIKRLLKSLSMKDKTDTVASQSFDAIYQLLHSNTSNTESKNISSQLTDTDRNASSIIKDNDFDSPELSSGNTEHVLSISDTTKKVTFNKGVLKIGDYTITEEEYNSMSEEEKQNFKNCL